MRATLVPLIVIAASCSGEPDAPREAELDTRPALIAALLTSAGEGSVAPEVLLYEDGFLVFAAREPASYFAVHLDSAEMARAQLELRVSPAWRSLADYYRFSNGDDDEEVRVVLRDSSRYDAVWVYGWGVEETRDSARSPAEFKRVVQSLLALRPDPAIDAAALIAVDYDTLAHAAVWRDPFVRIRNQRLAPQHRFGVGLFTVGVLGFLFAIAGFPVRLTAKSTGADPNLLRPAATAVGFALLVLLIIGIVITPL